MSLVIVSQMEEGFNAQLARHPLAPSLIAAPQAEPWPAAPDADVLITHHWSRSNWHVACDHTRVRDVFLVKVSANLDRFARGARLTDLVDRSEGY